MLSLSFTKEENMAIVEAFKEARWLKALLINLGFNNVIIYSDCQSALNFAKLYVFPEWSKQIDLKTHFFKDVASTKR